MSETLLSSSSILLYGVELSDIAFVKDREYVGDGRARELQDQLQYEPDADKAEDVRLARIYGFAFAGMSFQMGTPAIFVVHGPGSDPKDQSSGSPLVPGNTDQTGVFAQSYDFSKNIKYWTYDKNDISLRMDISTGSLETLLLDLEIGDEHGGGHGNPVGGGRVGGGRVGGGRVGGGRVGGGRVGGGRVGSD
ncbi:MAG: hypothetical protein AAF409_00330 [Pseudomonadota bacterium]